MLTYTRRIKRQTLLSVFLLFIIASIVFVRQLIHKEREGLKKYRKSIHELQQLKAEKAVLSRHELEYSHIIAEKDKRIDHLEKIIKKYGKNLYFNTANAERCLKESVAYILIESKAIKGELMTSDDWNTINMLVSEYLPGFDDFLSANSALLSDKKRQICLLLRLHFRSSDISNMLETSSAYISQESSRILRSIFQKKGSSRELSAELCKIF